MACPQIQTDTDNGDSAYRNCCSEINWYDWHSGYTQMIQIRYKSACTSAHSVLQKQLGCFIPHCHDISGCCQICSCDKPSVWTGTAAAWCSAEQRRRCKFFRERIRVGTHSDPISREIIWCGGKMEGDKERQREKRGRESCKTGASHMS